MGTVEGIITAKKGYRYTRAQRTGEAIGARALKFIAIISYKKKQLYRVAFFVNFIFSKKNGT